MYNKLYNFLKNSIIILSLLIGVKSFAYTDPNHVSVGSPDPDNECKIVTSLTPYTSLYTKPIGTECQDEANYIRLSTEYIDIQTVGCTHKDWTTTTDQYDLFYETITFGEPKVCSGDLVLNTSTCVCECPQDTIYFEATQTCVPLCVGDNKDYTSNGGCACDDGFTFVGDNCVYGDDPSGDDDNDGVPNYDDPDYDNDNDGVSNGVDSDWLEEHPTYDPTDGEDTYEGYCDSLPVLVMDSPAGAWYKNGQLSICGTTEQNYGREGDTKYVSRVDAYTCSPINVCVVKLSGCALGEYYNEALGSCALPREDVTCNETLNYLIANNNGLCQKNFLCEDGLTVYASESVDCPVEGSAEDNASVNISTQQQMVDALKQYGSATESGQKDIVENIKVTNDSLENINDTLSGIDTLMNHQNDKIDVTNESLEKLNTLITDGVKNNYEQLGDIQGAINSADVANQNGLGDISDKLQEIIDKNVSSSTDLGKYFEGENPFDGNYTDGSENFSAYSSELNTSFSSFVITDPLGLNSMGSSYTVPEIGFSIQGVDYNLFGASFLSYVPIELIRAMFMFMAVMSGLFVFFRTV